MKIRRSPKAGSRHIQKVAKNIVENMLQKICYLAVDCVLFSFCLLFHDARKNLSFKTNNLISKNKIWWENR